MTERINITVPSDLLAAIDKAAASQHLTRSGFLRAAALDRLGADEVHEGALAYAPRRDAAPVIDGRILRAWPPSPEVAAALLTAFFAARDDVEVAYLFGSVARGEAHAGSDLDVAVLLADDATGEREWNTHAEVLARVSSVFATNDIDVVILNSAPMALSVDIVQEGIVVAGAHRPLRVRYEAEVLSHSKHAKATAAAHYAALRDRVLGGGPLDE